MIRPAGLADEAALRSFRCQAPGEPWAAAPEVTVTTYVPVWIRDRSAHVWVADEAGMIVGVIALTIDDADETVAVSQVLAVTVASDEAGLLDVVVHVTE